MLSSRARELGRHRHRRRPSRISRGAHAGAARPPRPPDRSRRRRSSPPAQSIPPSTRRTLAALDLLAAVETAGFYPWRGSTVWWVGEAPRVENFPPGVSGWQVVRENLRRRLARRPAAGGVEVWTAVVRDVSLPDTDASDVHAVVIADRDDRTERLQSRFIIDCSGRAGIVARRGLRHHEMSHHTIALVGVWETADTWGVPDETPPPGRSSTDCDACHSRSRIVEATVMQLTGTGPWELHLLDQR